MTVTNLDRANWADKAILAFREQTGCDHEDAFGDLLCDLMHWADEQNFDFDMALDRARMHYDAESSTTATTPYMAVFNIPAGTATQIFHANSSEEALELARKLSDNGGLTEADFDPTAEGYCVREIAVSDEQGQELSVWQTDEYRLQLAAPKLLKALEKQIQITRQIIDAWNNTDHLYSAVEDLISELDSKSQWAQEVLRASDRCDLTAPIEALEKSLDTNLAVIAETKGGAA